MKDILLNIAIGLATSAIGAVAGLLLQSALRRRAAARRQAFFGLPAGTECLLVVPRYMGGSGNRSVHRDDVSALMELAVLVESCSARPEIVSHDQVRQGLGRQAEFCLGGPTSNERTVAHLGWRLPGVRFDYDPDRPDPGAIVVGDREFREEPTGPDAPGCRYALLARLDPEGGGRPVFLIAGQNAVANHAAVRYLTNSQRDLVHRQGAHGTFAVVLRVVNPERYGPDVVEFVADVTASATATPAAAAPARAS
ncbi:hypothetical protein [Kitasatospora viridis]|uniref:Secreted protein n=1 Tax=Kitasatospora viridis TaxID=281105 RepID=A0A561UJW8_9ACTN|nr:hypothetical protein [Kitasatospora viridis]TWF99662.1 hypothetical protein FHX73_113509 [Kitasatospora viridis]